MKFRYRKLSYSIILWSEKFNVKFPFLICKSHHNRHSILIFSLFLIIPASLIGRKSRQSGWSAELLTSPQRAANEWWEIILNTQGIQMQDRKMIKIICTNLIDDGWPIQTLRAYKLMHNGKIIWKYMFKRFITAANYILFHNLDQLLSLKCWLFKLLLSTESTKKH